MKFVCDRCGKKYATAGDPAPGKVYRLKCKACGHLIVVKGQAGTMTAVAAVTAADVTASPPVQEPPLIPAPMPPEVELHVEPEPISNDAIEPPAPAPLPPEVAAAVDSAAGASEPELLAPSLGSEEPFEALPMLLDPALAPPPPEKDELADFAAAAAEVMGAPTPGDAGQVDEPDFVDPFGADTSKKPASDPFAAAARASLPDSWAGRTPGAARPEPSPVPVAAVPAAAPARAGSQKSGLSGVPIAIIGVGMLALVGITAFALLGRTGSPPPVAASPRPAPTPVLPMPAGPEAAPPTPGPVAGKNPEPALEPRVAEKKPEPKAEPKGRPPERKPDKKPEPKVAEKKPEPPRPPAAPPPAGPAATPAALATTPEPRDAELPDAAAALTQDVVNRVVGANRKAFSTCIAAASGSDVKLDGRRVALRITVNTNGTVTYPTLDDQSLNTTEMGQCLKSAARLMIFPKFKGDPFHYEVPLILTGG